jgi:hypothetical protein
MLCEMRTKKRTAMGIILGVAAGLALCAGLALAKKPGKPPPEPPLDSGTIYFVRTTPYSQLPGTVHKMDPDGTNVTALSSTLHVGDHYTAEPSHGLHGGDRWFLQVMAITGETYPNGLTRYELCAVNETGTEEVQLTNDIDVELMMPDVRIRGEAGLLTYLFPRWATRGTIEDGKASYVGRRWVNDGNGNWSVTDVGIYVVEVDPSSFWSAYTPRAPSYIDLPLDIVSNQAYGSQTQCDHDWSPDGTSLVYMTRGTTSSPTYKGLWRADASDGFANPVRLTTDQAFSPRWSPKGDLIVFHGGGISTIKPDGKGQTVVIAKPAPKGNKRFWPEWSHWSPNGTHLTYTYSVTDDRRRQNTTVDVYRAVADGTHRTNLTAASDDFCRPYGWRD